MITLQSLKERLANFPKENLTHLPTPIELVTRPTRDIGAVNLMIKRDDQTGLAFGGNKARKLEYIIGDVAAKGADTIVTWAGVQSNWCRQTAAAAARIGVQPVLILLKKPGVEAGYDGNLLLDHLCGAAIHVVEIEPDRGFLELDDVADIVLPVVDELKAAGRTPYLAPIGGSMVEGSMSQAFGAMGYAAALAELLEQANEVDLWIDTIVHATGSAGTQAGLVAAAKAVAPQLKVVGISVSSDRETLRGYVRNIGTDLLGALGVDDELNDDDVIVFDEYLEPGYGVLTPEISREIAALARSEGILLDPVYTGKAWLGMMDLIETGRIISGENVVFIHTGGTPALFPYRDQLMGFLEE
jgi:D-cysteine desulfhydrase family pyridoxal phosphate-dependent enzyme